MNTIKFIVAILFSSTYLYFCTSISLSPPKAGRIDEMREEENLPMMYIKAMIEKMGSSGVLKHFPKQNQGTPDNLKFIIKNIISRRPMYVEGVDKFQNTELQTLYNQLVTKEVNLYKMLWSEHHEDLDIAVLINWLVSNRTKRFKWSVHHMNLDHYNTDGFARQLSKYDVTYQPKYMSESSFLEVQTNNSEKRNQSCSGS